MRLALKAGNERLERSFACPECGVAQNNVIDTRQVDGRRRRRRMCDAGHRSSTLELRADELARIEKQLSDFREWQATMTDLLAVGRRNHGVARP